MPDVNGGSTTVRVDRAAKTKTRTRPDAGVSSLHPLVDATKKALEQKKPDERGLVWSHGDDRLDVGVGPGNVGRAVRILDALVKAMRGQGMEIKQASFAVAPDDRDR
jgi:hypothetical protein